MIRVQPYRGKGATQAFDVVGPVCETSDCFGRKRKLPKDIGTDHLIAILSAGAYGFSMASTYNSRPRPAEVLVENGKATLIRRRETIQELFEPEMI
jgi:diaminopimelate decarboxylase